ncbi:uncharacterized protein LOC128966434 [Oppia nitens]|uniref:uncharacterized protein LOC128966434 n=1 Tax=Oppia nitens TaxID=1686743 RepID=UPI0023DBE3D9|nr:uncharacterized protein LOC128966434 [Oppia nitens]
MASILTDICQKLLIFILLNGICIEDCQSLRIINLEVPLAVAKGQSVILFCNYDLEGDELYSVKYYKDYVEFYRYLPTDDPRPGQKFKLNGAYVDITRSNATHAFLSYTDLNSDGMYACEVSTEGPSFATIRSERLMKVYALPVESLRIVGKEVEYDVNDKINMSCKSGSGRPLPHLQWLINDNTVRLVRQNALQNHLSKAINPKHPASSDQLISYKTKTSVDGLQSSQLGLTFRATPNYFHRGVLRLRCTATLTLLYDFEAIEYVVSGGTARNKTYLSNQFANKDWSLQSDNKDTPIILGVQQKYNVNDVLAVNCSSVAQGAQLKWLINDQQVNSSQTIRYNSDKSGKSVLGLTFMMEVQHFQLQELKLSCVAQHSRTIAHYSDDVVIRTMNQELMEAQSNVGVHSNAYIDKICGLTYTLAAILLFSMQNICISNNLFSIMDYI